MCGCGGEYTSECECVGVGGEYTSECECVGVEVEEGTHQSVNGDLGLGKRIETGRSNSPYKHNRLFVYLFAQLIAEFKLNETSDLIHFLSSFHLCRMYHPTQL